MRARLNVNRYDVGPGLGKGLKIRIAGRDHQMDVEGLPREGPDRLDHRGADRDIGDEVPVHHIDMDPVRTGSLDCAYFIAELGKIGR